jgi:hypothetical protein
MLDFSPLTGMFVGFVGQELTGMESSAIMIGVEDVTKVMFGREFPAGRRVMIVVVGHIGMGVAADVKPDITTFREPALNVSMELSLMGLVVRVIMCRVVRILISFGMGWLVYVCLDTSHMVIHV